MWTLELLNRTKQLCDWYGEWQETDKRGVQVKGTRGERRRRRRRRGQNLTVHRQREKATEWGTRERACVCVCGKIVVQNLILFAKGNSSHALVRRPLLSGCDDILETLSLLFSLPAPTTVNNNSYKCFGPHSFFSDKNLGWHFNAFWVKIKNNFLFTPNKNHCKLNSSVHSV